MIALCLHLVKHFFRRPSPLHSSCCKNTTASCPLAAGKYVVFTHRGTFANLFKAHQYIYGTWLPTAKAVLNNREDFLLYERPVQSFADPDNVVNQHPEHKAFPQALYHLV